MIKIVEMEFGSKIYGTAVPASDTDYKGIFIPSAKSILLQKAERNISTSTKKDPGAKNTSEDIDSELISYQEYLKLLMKGETMALDMLFCPTAHIIHRDDEFASWFDQIVRNKEKLLHKGTTAFFGYAKTQAAKYGLKGSRIAAVRRVIEVFQTFDKNKKLHEYAAELHALSMESSLFDDKMNKEKLIRVEASPHEKDKGLLYFVVCGRMMPYTNKVSQALTLYQVIFDEYGHRAKLAETNQGIDWKALMHAVRVGNEGVELLRTGNITFPRPEAGLLLQIRKGLLPYKQVAELIEEALVKMQDSVATSRLRDKPDTEFADSLVNQVHKLSVVLDLP